MLFASREQQSGDQPRSGAVVVAHRGDGFALAERAVMKNVVANDVAGEIGDVEPMIRADRNRRVLLADRVLKRNLQKPNIRRRWPWRRGAGGDSRCKRR